MSATRRLPDVDELANFLRSTLGVGTMGMGELAERLVAWLEANGTKEVDVCIHASLLKQLLRYTPTDCEMADLGWGKEQIDTACDLIQRAHFELAKPTGGST